MMGQNHLLTLFLSVIAATLLMNGCVRIETSYVEKRQFSLDVSSPDSDSAQPPEGAVLRVDRFRISPRYRSKSFVYRMSDLHYESDFYNEFIVSPASLITEEARQWLETSGLFSHVIDLGSRLEATHILEGEVSELYGDYRNGTVPKAVLGISFLIIREDTPQDEVIFQKEYHQEVPLKSKSPQALAEGWNETLRRIMANFRGDLAGVDINTSPSASK